MANPADRLRNMRINLARPSTRVAIVLTSFGANQAIRLAMSIALTHLLAPPLLGVMVIINTLRTGIELLTDIGLGANVVRHPEGATPEFLQTAWTAQIVRGIILMLACLSLAAPVSQAYDNPNLLGYLAASSALFAITGFRWTAIFVLQKQQRVFERAAFDMATNILFTLVTILLTWSLRSVWGLILGLIAGEVIITAATFLIKTDARPKFRFNIIYAREIFKFGKWIFAGSILYFCAMSFDKVYFSVTISLFLLGVYNVGRTLSDAAGQAIIRIGEFIIFPAIAAFDGNQNELTKRLRAARLRMLALAALGLSAATSLSPMLIIALYDARYRAAALIAPTLLLSVWPSLLSIVSEMTLRGLGRSAPGALGNALKLIGLAIGLPIGFYAGGMAGAMFAIIIAEWLRYAAISYAGRADGISFIQIDMTLSLIFLALTTALFMSINITILDIILDEFLNFDAIALT